MPAAVRNVLTDLVEKRLWPVALLLVAALVAVPFVIRGGGDAGAPAVADAGDSGTTAGLVSFTDTEGSASERTGGGSVRNPFEAPFKKKTGASGGSQGGDGDGDGGGSQGDTTSPGIDTGGLGGPLPDLGLTPVGGGPTVPGGPVPSPPSTGGTGTGRLDSFSVDLRFGPIGQTQPAYNVPRLMPLPPDGDPFFVYLGVLADGKTALFLLSSDAKVEGDGVCRPTPAQCERIELQPGETEFFEITNADGTKAEYQLDVTRVAKVRASNVAEAAAARSRESEEGRDLLRDVVREAEVSPIADLAYSQRLGMLVPAPAYAENRDDPGVFGGYKVDLRFGEPGRLARRYDLARLSPLPSAEAPAFLFMGVLPDAETVLFLNPTEATASGDAVCDPDPQHCQRVRLQAGDRAAFDVPTLDGRTVSYELAVDGITEVRARTAAEAEASRERESGPGRRILRRIIDEVGELVEDLSFDRAKAVITQARRG
jgi:hypothetical protein